MKEWEDSHVFSHPWSRIIKAAYKKYPNPYSSQVHSLDTVDRRVNGNRLHSYRLFCTIWNVPSFVMRLITDDGLVQVKEHSVCDVEGKTLILMSRNVSFSSKFTMIEKLEYTVCEEDPSKTVLKQSATFDVFGLPLLSGVLERLWYSQYKSSLTDGRQGLEYVANLIAEKEHSESNSTRR